MNSVFVCAQWSGVKWSVNGAVCWSHSSIQGPHHAGLGTGLTGRVSLPPHHP